MKHLVTLLLTGFFAYSTATISENPGFIVSDKLVIDIFVETESLYRNSGRPLYNKGHDYVIQQAYYKTKKINTELAKLLYNLYNKSQNQILL